MTRETKWKTIDWECCPECGNDVEVNTSAIGDDEVHDNDAARCVDTNCPTYGTISVDEDDIARVIWND